MFINTYITQVIYDKQQNQLELKWKQNSSFILPVISSSKEPLLRASMYFSILIYTMYIEGDKFLIYTFLETPLRTLNLK